MRQNMFQFRGDFYRQRDGTSMGNPLSGFVANLFMSRFEMDLKEEGCLPRVRWRYVDDVFVIMNRRFVEKNLEKINRKHPTIKFTVEKEIDGELPFLDVIVSHENGTLSFHIYRKPTSTRRFISSNSHHHRRHKQTAFHSMIHRLVCFPLTNENFEKRGIGLVKLQKLMVIRWNSKMKF